MSNELNIDKYHVTIDHYINYYGNSQLNIQRIFNYKYSRIRAYDHMVRHIAFESSS